MNGTFVFFQRAVLTLPAPFTPRVHGLAAAENIYKHSENREPWPQTPAAEPDLLLNSNTHRHTHTPCTRTHAEGVKLKRASGFNTEW